MKKNDAARSKRWRERLVERGLVEVKVLVPSNQRQEIQSIAKKMRDKHDL